jgi:two-component system, LytTR family, sensor histidine kinase AlgZ
LFLNCSVIIESRWSKSRQRVIAGGTATDYKDPDGSSDAAETAKARRQTEGAPAPVIPDCCNIGVCLRTIVILNAAAILAAFTLAPDVGEVWPHLLRIALVLEPTVLLSLGTLCIVRKWANGQRLPVQWIVALAVPSLIAAAVTWTLLAVVTSPPISPSETIKQSPALWITTRAICAAVIAAAMYEYFGLRARAYAPSFSEARLQALQARIRPHFLFNSLNTVLGLIRTEPRLAEHTLENLADLFRVFMRDARELVPLDDEVITCKEYLAIEHLRLSTRLQVSWDIDEMPGDALLPSLLLQPLLENAVHHGIEPRLEPGLISIRITKPGDRVRVEIDNPLSTTPAVRPGNQMALSNVRERLMLLYDMEAELKTGPQGELFRLHLEFPYRKERRRRDVRRNYNPDR